MGKKRVNNREYLKKILYEFEFIGENGATDSKTEDCVIMRQEHNGYFVFVPDVLRRCLFLTVVEKEVLWELFSWASNDGGYCSVSQKIISLNVNIAESTVKKAIKELVEKGFIEKASTIKRRNVYKMGNLPKNPYIILSEFIHNNLQVGLRYLRKQDGMLFEGNRTNIPYSIDGYTAAVTYFTKNPCCYMPYIDELRFSKEGFVQTYEKIVEEVYDALNKLYVDKALELSTRYPRKYNLK